MNQKIELAKLIACALERGILIEEITNLTGLDAGAIEELRQSRLSDRQPSAR